MENKQMIISQEEYKDIVKTYLQNQNQTLTESEFKQFIMICYEYQLNPLKREIYAVKYRGTVQPIIGYQEYLKRAERTKLLDYYEINIDQTKGLGTFIGKRMDRSKPLTIQFNFQEWVQKDFSGKPMSLWITKPMFMFRKCILVVGMRELFPMELGNLPYTREEMWMEDKEVQKDILEDIKKEEEGEKNNENQA